MAVKSGAVVVVLVVLVIDCSLRDVWVSSAMTKSALHEQSAGEQRQGDASRHSHRRPEIAGSRQCCWHLRRRLRGGHSRYRCAALLQERDRHTCIAGCGVARGVDVAGLLDPQVARSIDHLAATAAYSHVTLFDADQSEATVRV